MVDLWIRWLDWEKFINSQDLFSGVCVCQIFQKKLQMVAGSRGMMNCWVWGFVFLALLFSFFRACVVLVHSMAQLLTRIHATSCISLYIWRGKSWNTSVSRKNILSETFLYNLDKRVTVLPNSIPSEVSIIEKFVSFNHLTNGYNKRKCSYES